MTDWELARELLPDEPEIAYRAIRRMGVSERFAAHQLVMRNRRTSRYYRGANKPFPAPTTGPIKGDVHLTIVREEFL